MAAYIVYMTNGETFWSRSQSCADVYDGLVWKYNLSRFTFTVERLTTHAAVESGGVCTSLSYLRILKTGSSSGSQTAIGMSFQAFAEPPSKVSFLNSLSVGDGVAIAAPILLLWAFAWAVRSIRRTL